MINEESVCSHIQKKKNPVWPTIQIDAKLLKLPKRVFNVRQSINSVTRREEKEEKQS